MIKDREEHTISSSISYHHKISMTTPEDGHPHFYFLYGGHDCRVSRKGKRVQAIATSRA